MVHAGDRNRDVAYEIRTSTPRDSGRGTRDEGLAWFLRTPPQRDRDVAGAAQQAVVVEAAFAAAVGDGQNVIGFPSRTVVAPRAPLGAVGRGRFAAPPSSLGERDVEAAEPADAAVALPHLIAHVPRIASDPPFVNARVAAERAARPTHDGAAPSAGRASSIGAVGLAARVGRHRAPAYCAHPGVYGVDGPRLQAGPVILHLAAALPH